MKIVLTAEEIIDQGCWDDFCELRGFNVWAVNEGLMDSSEEFELTKEELQQIHFPVSDTCSNCGCPARLLPNELAPGVPGPPVGELDELGFVQACPNCGAKLSDQVEP